MRSPSVDLLLRVLGDQLGGRECEHCGTPLARGRFALREQTAERFVVEIACSTCKTTSLLLVQPEVDGTAHIQ